MRVLVAITRGELGGAQAHVRDLILGLKDRVDFRLIVGEEEGLAEQLAPMIPVQVLPALQRELSPRADRAAYEGLEGALRQHRPQLLHTHSTKAGLLGRVAARRVGVPGLHTAHSWAFSEGIRSSRRVAAVLAEAAVGRVTRGVIAVSEHDRDLALRFRVIPRERLRVVHNGVADSPLRARPESGPPVLTMVARFAAPKDHELLLRAAAQVRGEWRLRLVGDGPELDASRLLAQQLGLGRRVDFTGARDDVPEHLASSSALLLISRQEGFPLSILEGMRAGLPVLASRVGGVAEAVIPGQTGLLVDRGDQQGLSSALQRLVDEPALRASMGARGRARWEQRFTLDRMLSQTLLAYQEVAR